MSQLFVMTLVFLIFPVLSEAQGLEFRGSDVPLLSARPLEHGSVPSNISFGWASGDHHVKSLGFLQTPQESVRLFLSDKDGNDFVRGRLDFTYLWGLNERSQLKTFTATCVSTRECRLSIAFPPNELSVFAIAGFLFENLSGSDTHIRKFGLEPLASGNYIYLAHFKDNGSEFRYRVTIQGYWLDRSSENELVMRNWTASSDGRTVPRTQMSRTSSGGFLRGFMFNWDNSDHHLFRWQILFTKDRISTNLSDLDGNDPYTVNLYWAEYNY